MKPQYAPLRWRRDAGLGIGGEPGEEEHEQQAAPGVAEQHGAVGMECREPGMLEAVGKHAACKRAGRAGERACQVVPGEDRVRASGGTSCDSDACSMDRNGPTSLPLG